MNNKNPRYIIYEILYNFFTTKTSLKFIIGKYPLKRKDSAFIINILKGILRDKKILDQNIYLYSKRKKNDLKSMILLYIGTYQLLYCDSVPDYAAINTTVDMAKSINIKSSGFINAILRNINRQPYKRDKTNPIDIYYSYPKWFLGELSKIYKNEIHSICEINSKEPPLWIRINTLKTSLDEISTTLSKEKILFSKDEFLSNYIKFEGFDKRGVLLTLIKEGKVYVQNPSSGFVIKLLKPFKNDIILDACSAPGGKASYIAELTENKADITCMDINENRIERMKKNFNILRVKNVNFLNANASSIKNNKKYNKILLDLPCTSSGTIRKNPDIKWIINKNNLKKIQELQYAILDNMKNSLEDKGEIIYSTCSILSEENDQNIIKFLNKNSNFSISEIDKNIPNIFKNKLGGITILPNSKDYEGMFAIKIKKNA